MTLIDRLTTIIANMLIYQTVIIYLIMVKIKSRHETLNDVIRDAKKYPQGWKAIFGKDKERLSKDYYIFHPNIGIYLLKEYHKNPFEVKGIGGKIARHVDDDIENEITKTSNDFGIIQGDIRRILKNVEKGIPPQKIFDAAIRNKGKKYGMSMPVRGQSSASEDSFKNLHDTLSTKQKRLDSKLEKIAYDDGLYSSYE